MVKKMTFYLINIFSPNLDSMTYVLLNLYGEQGWHEDLNIMILNSTRCVNDAI